MTRQPVIDERAVAVAGVSYRLAYTVLSIGALIDMVVRGYVLKEAAWDLMALVIASGAVANLYMWAKHVRVFSWWRLLVMMVLSAVVAAAVAVVLTLYR